MVTLRVMTSLFAAFTLAIAFSGSAVRADGVTMEDLVNDQKTTTDVLTWGMGPRGQRYSTLDKINKDNVNALIPAWSFSFGGGDSQRGEESQPLYRDGIIYVTGSRSRMWAIDARTGQEKWQYNPRLPDGTDAVPCCDVVNRGAAIFGDKVFLGTIAARLVALNAETGKVVWNKSLGDIKEGYSYTAAPMVVDGKVITGVSGGEYGIVGRVDARDTETGDLVWSRPVVEGHMGELNGKPSTMTGKLNETWPGDTWKHGGGATWLGGSYDPDTKLVFFGTGNPAPWNAHFRKGDNRWTSARIAINPDNGEIVWGFQTTPNDGWDYDGVNEFILFDIEEDGKTVKAGATADRNGFFYVLDRTNGKFIRGLPFVEQITWAKGLDENGRPILGDALPSDPRSSPDKKKGSAADVTPPFFGGKNQPPMAYSQQTGLFYVPSNEWTMKFWYEGEPTYKKGQYYIAANFTLKPLEGFDHIGSLKAVDPVKGEIKWQVDNRAPLWGGVMTTAGGLVFYGTPEGFLKALDAETGKELWKFQTGSGIVAPPITWEMDGDQYVGVASGWGGAVPLWGGEVNKFAKYTNEGGSFWVFKLHKRLAAN